MTEQTLIGKPLKLQDGRSKVMGHVRYVGDIKIPGMLHARIVPSTYAHANIISIDKEAALAVPGVVAVLTAEDLPDIAPSSRGRLFLARGRVIFYGQPVALVVAESEAAAADALDLVTVDYDPQPVAATIDEALADGAPLVWPTGVPKGSDDAGAHGADVAAEEDDEAKPITNIAAEGGFEKGDLDAGFAEADVIVERIFTTPMAHQNSMETHGTIAQPDPVTGGMTIWASTQGPFSNRQEVAELLNVRETDIRVISTPVGGGFGGKFGLYEGFVAVVAKTLGRTVRLILTRMDELAATNPAPAIRIKARLGAKNDGTLTALDATIHVDGGCYPGGFGGFGSYLMAAFYRIPNYRLKGIDVMTFKQSTGAYRAPIAPHVTYALDTLIDEIAENIGMDSIDMRIMNAAQGGDELPDGRPMPRIGMRETLETVREHPLWKNREKAKKEGRGVGVAIGGWPGGIEPGAAVCQLNRDGVVQINVGVVDLTGTLTTFTLLAAETYGVSPEHVRVVYSDTDSAPYSGGTGGSKITYSMANAVIDAAKEARRQTLEIAAEEFEAAIEDLDIIDNKIQVKGVPEKTMTLGEIASLSQRFGGQYAPVHANGRAAVKTNAPAFNAQLIEVEVDEDVGEVRVLSQIAFQDVGKILNPLMIEGQIMGGSMQGIGWALYEEMMYDDDGQLLSGSWMDYTVPHADQGSESFESILLEIPSDNGPLGVRGVGEPPVVPSLAAVANAVAHATGARISNLPMRAPQVLEALQARNGSK